MCNYCSWFLPVNRHFCPVTPVHSRHFPPLSPEIPKDLEI